MTKERVTIQTRSGTAKEISQFFRKDQNFASFMVGAKTGEEPKLYVTDAGVSMIDFALSMGFDEAVFGMCSIKRSVSGQVNIGFQFVQMVDGDVAGWATQEQFGKACSNEVVKVILQNH